MDDTQNNTTPASGRIGRALSKTFYSLRNRNFRLFFIGQMISNTGNWLTNIALTLLVLKITGSGLAVGVLTAVQYGPALFLSPWGGAIADRVNKHRALFITQGLEMVQSVGLAIFAFMPHPPLYGFFLLALLGGILLPFDNALRRSFVTEMVVPEDIPNAVVLYSTIVNVSRMIGPALAGLLVVTLGYVWCFSVDALTYLVVLYCIYSMRPDELHRESVRPQNRGAILDGFRYIRSQPPLWISLAMLGVIGALSCNFNVTLPLLVTSSLHSTSGMFTILYSVFSLGAVLGALGMAHRGGVKISHVIFGAISLGVTMLLLAIMPSIATAMLAVFFVGAATSIYMNATTTLVQVGARRDMHGRMLALQMAFVAGTTIIGGPISGWLADVAGARTPLILGGVAALCMAAFGHVVIQRHIAEESDVLKGA